MSIFTTIFANLDPLRLGLKSIRRTELILVCMDRLSFQEFWCKCLVLLLRLATRQC